MSSIHLIPLLSHQPDRHQYYLNRGQEGTALKPRMAKLKSPFAQYANRQTNQTTIKVMNELDFMIGVIGALVLLAALELRGLPFSLC